MFYQRKRRFRRFALLLIGAGAAGAIGIASGDDPPPSLDVGQVALKTSKEAPKKEIIVKPDPLAEALKQGNLVGGSALAGALDLDKMVLEDGAYWVKVGDSRARLTLEPRLQEKANELLVKSRAPQAAIVMMTPEGRVLALAGRRHGPPVDDKAFELATETWAPAASVFKIVTAAALLDKGVSPTEQVCFHDGLRSVTEANLKDDAKRDNRCGNLSQGVAESQNAIMAKLAHRRLDSPTLEKTARAFGFDSAPSFALAAEASSFEIPEESLERARMAAGFWSSELSAVGGAILTNVVASGGNRVQPQLVSYLEKPDGTIVPVNPAPSVQAMPAKRASQLTSMMVRTTESGTGRKAFGKRAPGTPLFGMKVAGKTGSLSQVDPSYLGFSWFVGFAPADKPEVIVSVILGNPMSWHIKGHTTGRLLLETALSGKARQMRAESQGIPGSGGKLPVDAKSQKR